MKLFIAITKDNGLYCIEWDKPYNDQKGEISLTASEYDNPKTDTVGYNEAYDTLSSAEYWRDVGCLGRADSNFLEGFIDFKVVAEHVLNSDGWTQTNGEFIEFGEHEGEAIFFNLSSCGQHRIKEEDVKAWLIPEEQAKRILYLWDTYHLNSVGEKEFKKVMQELTDIFDSNKKMSSEQEALDAYYKEVKE